MPVVEFEFHPEHKYRFDYCWPAVKVALEVEGGLFGGKDAKGRQYKGAHSSISGMLRDLAKYNGAAIHGWRVLRVTPDQLFTQGTVDMLVAVLGRQPEEAA